MFCFVCFFAGAGTISCHRDLEAEEKQNPED